MDHGHCSRPASSTGEEVSDPGLALAAPSREDGPHLTAESSVLLALRWGLARALQDVEQVSRVLPTTSQR